MYIIASKNVEISLFLVFCSPVFFLLVLILSLNSFKLSLPNLASQQISCTLSKTLFVEIVCYFFVALPHLVKYQGVS